MKCLLPPLLVGASLMLAGCGNIDAVVKYHQVGSCNGGQGQSGDPSTFYNAGPNQAYVVFAIENVDNTQVTSSWTLDPTKFFVNSTVKDSFDPSLMVYRIFGISPSVALISTTIPASTNYGFSPYAYGALVVQTAASDGASEADKTKYNLLYTPTGPGVIMSQNPPASTAYTPNCADVQLQ
jgi:hypothetical protein